MRKSAGTYILIAVMLCSCAAAGNSSFSKKEYKRSKPLVTYSGMTNELQDGYLVLKQNNYFEFYQKIWLGITIRQAKYVGRYTQSKDTIYLDWMENNPKTIKNYLSSKCVTDSGKNSLWFIDEVTNEKLWGISRR